MTGAANRVEVCYKTVAERRGRPERQPDGTWRDPAGANQPENAPARPDVHRRQRHGLTSRSRLRRAGQRPRLALHGLDAQPRGRHAARRSARRPGRLGVGRPRRQRRRARRRDDAQRLARSPATWSRTAARRTRTAARRSHLDALQGRRAARSSSRRGTNHWSRGLGVNMAGVGEPNADIQQATTNILVDMGVAPTTPASGLVVEDPAALHITDLDAGRERDRRARHRADQHRPRSHARPRDGDPFDRHPQRPLGRRRGRRDL